MVADVEEDLPDALSPLSREPRSPPDEILSRYEHPEKPTVSVPLASQIVPHLTKAVELGSLYHRLRLTYGAVLGALDHVGVGMCVVVGDGDVLVANEEAERILDAGDGLSRSRLNRLVGADASQSSEVALTVSRLSATANSTDDRCVHTLHVPRASSESPIIVELAPLRDPCAEIDKCLSGALVTLIDTARHHEPRLDTFARVHGLTDAEIGVCRLIFDGLSREEIAEARGVKASTVKSQMKAIRSKTGVSSSIALLRLALQTSPPIS